MEGIWLTKFDSKRLFVIVHFCIHNSQSRVGELANVAAKEDWMIGTDGLFEVCKLEYIS